jgi:hypothetical protein
MLNKCLQFKLLTSLPSPKNVFWGTLGLQRFQVTATFGKCYPSDTTVKYKWATPQLQLIFAESNLFPNNTEYLALVLHHGSEQHRIPCVGASPRFRTTQILHSHFTLREAMPPILPLTQCYAKSASKAGRDPCKLFYFPNLFHWVWTLSEQKGEHSTPGCGGDGP